MRGGAGTPAPTRLSFATSNDHKFEEAKHVLSEFGLTLGRIRAKGREVQSDDVGAVAVAAALDISPRCSPPFFVEDTGLFVRSLGGFPGPFASYVYKTLGFDGVLSLLGRSKGRSAEFVSAVAYVGGSGRPKLFLGRLRGRIAPEARGSNGFGFDPVFVPLGSSRTLAEMGLEEKCAVSHRGNALRALGNWLVSRPHRESL